MKLHPLFFLFLSLLPVFASSQSLESKLNRSESFVRERDRLETLVAQIETESGPYAIELLEPLQGMAELYQGIGDFETVDELLSRQLQLMRTEQGLDHPDNILLVRSIIENKLRQQQWDAVSENLEHIRYLESVNQGENPDNLVAAVVEQARWSLLLVHLDEREERAKHVLDARRFYEDAEDILEKHYGEDHEKLVPIYYQQALTLYQLVAFLNSGNSLGSSAIREVVREDGNARLSTLNSTTSRMFQPSAFGSNEIVSVREGELIGESYLRIAISKIDTIRDIYEDQGDLEAFAMATIYYGDFQYLLGRVSGLRRYRKAIETLLEIGIAQESIDAFFAIPEVLPVPSLELSFAEAQARRQTILDQNSTQESLFLGEFSALEETASMVQMPSYAKDYGVAPATYSADVIFNISSRGEASSVDVESINSTERKVERTSKAAIRALSFRPQIVGGKSKSIKQARLNYRFSDAN